MERLSLVRDERVRSLEGQRGLLLGLLITLTVGAVVLYAAVFGPDSRRQSAALSEVEQRMGELRRRATDEIVARDRRAAELSTSLAEREGTIERLRRELKAAEEATKTKPHRVQVTRPVVGPTPKCPCDKADPLCDCW
jgi:hypothetical protein